jgi:DNA-binding MarR family transcriptional regulator
VYQTILSVVFAIQERVEESCAYRKSHSAVFTQCNIVALRSKLATISIRQGQVQQGSLYPALHRLEQKVWIKAKWAETGTGRKARFYSLTAAGRAQLEKEAAN